MAANEDGATEPGEPSGNPDRAAKQEKKAARKLRKAGDVEREAPLRIAPTEDAREAKRQERLRAMPPHPIYSPEELQRRREFAIRYRQEMAAAGAAASGTPMSVTPAAPVDTAPSAPAAAHVVATPAAAPKPRPERAPRELTPEEARLEKKRAAKARQQAAAEAKMGPLPDSWAPPVASGMAGGPSVLSVDSAQSLAAPVMRASPPGVYRQVRAWLAPRPGARGALTGLAMFLFWEICRAWSGEFPGPIDLMTDMLIWALVGLMAWRIFVWWEATDA